MYVFKPTGCGDLFHDLGKITLFAAHISTLVCYKSSDIDILLHLRSANQHISSSLLQSISHITPEYFPILFQPINRYDSL